MPTADDQIHTRLHPDLEANKGRWGREVQTVRDVTGGVLAIIESPNRQSYVPPRTGHLISATSEGYRTGLAGVAPAYDRFLNSCDLLDSTSAAVKHSGGVLDRVDPVVNVTDDMEPWTKDVTGDGSTVQSFGRYLEIELLESGRACVLVGGVDDVVQLSLFPGENVRYWEHDDKRALVELILQESGRVFWQLLLVDGVYGFRRHVKDVKDEWQTGELEVPLQAGGTPWPEIPAEVADLNRRWKLTAPPYFGLAEQNLAHFRTTGLEQAALENASPTGVLSGDLRNREPDGKPVAGQALRLAAGEVMHLAKESIFVIAEGSGATAAAAREKLKRLEESMTDTFRKLQRGNAAQSGAAVVAQDATRNAIPARVADVTSLAMTRVLRLAAPAFAPVTDKDLEEIAFSIDVDVIAAQLEGEAVLEFIADQVEKGNLPAKVLVEVMRKRKHIPDGWTDERIKEELANEAGSTGAPSVEQTPETVPNEGKE